MASVLSFDELEKLGIERRSVPHREWFSVIELPKDNIDSRVSLAESAEEEILDWFYFMLLAYGSAEMVNEAMAAQVLEQALLNAIPATQRSEYVDKLIAQTAQEVTEATIRHWDDPYFLSEDRAAVIAQNEAQMVNSYAEYEDAEARGFTSKTWHGMLDNRERESHVAAEDQTVPIGEDFFVGENSYFIVPTVPSEAGADPEEYVNCRCWATYN